MRAVVRTGVGALELNWSWLPTWIGMNTQLVRDIEQAIEPVLVGRELTDETLDEAHRLVLDYLADRFKLDGMFDYLDGLKYVTETTHDARVP